MLENNTTSADANAGEEILPPSAGGSLARSVGTSVAVPETDPERIAYNLWNEGRVDEAIQFLDREIAARRHGGSSAGDLSADLSHPKPSAIPPVSDWRDRHRAALAADFNAYGAAGSTLELSAQPADAIVPHPPKRPFRGAWIMGLCLAAAGLSGAALMSSGRIGESADTALPVTQAAREVAPVAIVPATDVASAKSDTNAAPSNLDQPSALEAGAVSAAADAAPPVEDNGTPNPEASNAAFAENVPDATDTTPPDEELPPTGDAIASDTKDVAPETTASIDTNADAAAQPEVRLPRQRPEPPAQVAARPAKSQRSVEASPSVIYAPNPPPGYEPSARGPFFDPLNHRRTLYAGGIPGTARAPRLRAELCGEEARNGAAPHHHRGSASRRPRTDHPHPPATNPKGGLLGRPSPFLLQSGSAARRRFPRARGTPRRTAA